MRIKRMSKPKKLEPVSPGEMLLEEFLKPLGISQYRLAKEIGVAAQRIDGLTEKDQTVARHAWRSWRAGLKPLVGAGFSYFPL